MNRNFTDMLSALSAEGAEYLVIGAHALSVHGYPRATGDINIWLRRSKANARRVMRALVAFGAPLRDLSLKDLATPDIVYRIGIPPQRIDILTSIAGVEFDQAWPDRRPSSSGGVSFPVISREHLLQNKRAAGRPKDLMDVAWLESEHTADDETT